MGTNGFDFARGNLSKLTRLPLYALGKPAQWLIPRTPKQWVFGSGAGVAQGAWELWQEVARREPMARMVWLVANDAQEDQAREAGIDWVYAQSWRGFWRTLRAKTLVVTHGLGDVNRYASGGGYVVQLWHGIPLKRIHLDSPATLNLGRRVPAVVTALLRRLYRAGSRRISLFPVPSALVASRIHSAFDLPPERILISGDPRDEALVSGSKRERAALACRVLEGAGVVGAEDSGRRVVLFAPTWRDGDQDPAVPGPQERDALQGLAEELDLIIVVRPHPLGVGSYRSALAGADRLRMADSEAVADVNQILSGVELLITDYSSVAMDYSLTGSHLVWFAPDREEYERTRGLYEDYATTTGEHEKDWAGVVERVREALSVPDGATARASLLATRSLRDRFFDVTEPGAPGRVYDAILADRTPGQHRDEESVYQPQAGADVREAEPVASDVASSEPMTPGPVVFFESFYGLRANDNPAGIDAALARLRPEVRRIWSVASEAVQVPSGAEQVVEGTPAWEAARRDAGLFVLNDWLRTPVPRPGEQKVLQTWHGTPLKNLALGRPKVGLRTRLAILKQSRRWDALLSQNPYSSHRLATDYAFRGPVWELGYPRNDRLSPADPAAARAAARVDLGLSAHARVVLYAPTWRDDGRIVLDGAGIARVQRALSAADSIGAAGSGGEGTEGDDVVILVRAHSRVAEGLGDAGAGTAVRDVSGENGLERLLLAADVLVTDYSSVMFDAAVTSIPMVFHVPDLELYRDSQRGFGLDFETRAPGPLTRTEEELVQAIRAASTGDAEFEWRYAAWRADFTPWDDGAAGERVVRRLEAEGFLR
ncbi:CDP-glycerol glycerophosphotransferase family protein [Galactobacter caseinivorans]|uniref:Glycosyl/glycerophosphate transferase n=1 Tax=Galactobacter caseinivorans TaxID=2676123 RepID=A0A496PLV2_9MICC|nr:CDP-glycerol glycerophosphotransferase family protein [Galactobacter caseinivorans]RKW71502.1 glycosyl/glycerophosphate transferase [Galactobacter caseinivorans]